MVSDKAERGQSPTSEPQQPKIHQPRVIKPRCTPGPDLLPTEYTVPARVRPPPHRQTGQGEGSSATLSVTAHAHGVVWPTRYAAQGRALPFIVQGHPRGVQVGVLHGLHLWAPQEVVQRVEGVGGPGDGLGWLAGLAGGAGACTQRVASVHVVHGAGHQVTWRGGGQERGGQRISSQCTFFQGSLLARGTVPKPAGIITVYPEAAGGGGNCHPDAQ